MRNAAIMFLAAGAGLCGCSPTVDQFVTDQRLDRGLVIILPGIEGEGPLSYGLRAGLIHGGVNAALPIYPWGRPIPLAGPLLNQVDIIGNRLAAQRIAQLIVDYQDSHAGMPVYLIGHSGGGGISVFTAEALPPGRSVEGLILLSASISSTYDLSKALAHCRKGVVNFYSGGDVGFLMIGTTLVGNVDGIRGPAAGAVGFDKSHSGLYQIPWTEEMASSGNYGGHMDTAGTMFVKRYVAPWVVSAGWPAGR